jgi:hypothetical protein
MAQLKKKPPDDALAAVGFKQYLKTVPTWMKKVTKKFSVDTKEGKMTGTAGDWLCIGEEGEAWPLAASLQKATYKPFSGQIKEILK